MQTTSPSSGGVQDSGSITRIANVADLSAAVGHEVVFSGKAEYFSQLPLGFVRIGSEEAYLGGLEQWPPGVVGKQVEVKGLLSRRKILADPTVNDWGEKNGAGTWGEQFVVDHARWHVVGDTSAVGPRAFSIDDPPRMYQLEPLIGHQVSIEGYPAVDAIRSGLQVGFRFDGYFLYVEGPEHWPDESDTQVMRVTGRLECKYDQPQPGLDSKGNILVAARYRPRYILVNSKVVRLSRDP